MSGPGGAPGAPWSAEPPAAAYNPYGAPASYRNRRSWGGSASGASVTYPGYGRNGGNWGPRPLPSPLRNLWWLFGGILTLGLIYPVPAVICWRRAYRFRAPQLRRPPALEWLIWALTFTLLSAGVYIGWGFAIAAGSSDNSSGGPFSYTPPKVTDLAFGSTATFKDEVAPPNDTGKAQISMTLSDLVHHPRTKVKDVNVTAQVRVCATSTSIDPLMAALSPTISPVGEPAGSSGLLPSPDYTLPDDFYHQLAPHRCVTGTIGYRFPTGATVNAFYLDGNAGDIVVWKLTHAQSGGPV